MCNIFLDFVFIFCITIRFILTKYVINRLTSPRCFFEKLFQFVSLETDKNLPEVELGFFDEAIKFYKSAVKLSPNDRYNYYKLGRAFVNKGLLDEAIGTYRDYIRLEPRDFDTLREIVSVINKKGLHKDDEIKKYLKDMGFNSEQINSIISSKQ